jgi:SNF2 family DNA or RNA helicase
MLIVPRKKAIILKLREPSSVLDVIPTAKRIVVKGQVLVAVPHRVEETKVLRNMGIEAPSPIRHYYDWPGQFAPFHAQREAAAFLTLYNRAFNLSELGTGKSLAALWALDYLRTTGVVNKTLIVSPLSTLERTWADECFRHFPHLEIVVLYGAAGKRRKLLAQDADVYIINHDGVEILLDDLRARTDINLVIVDEIAQVARNSGTDRWRALNLLVNQRQAPRMCWGLTGTPTPNGPTDAWAQCRLLVPANVPPYFNRFREQVMRQVSTYTWAAKPNAMDVVREVMQPAIRFTRDECLDLPDLMFETREVPLTEEQQSAYKSMMTTMKIEAENGQILAVNEAVKLGKLLQVVTGVAYNTDGEEVLIPSTHRANAVKEIVESAEGKVIIFVPFVSAVRHLAEFLQKSFSVAIIHGGVKKVDRDNIFRDFQKAAEPKVLVAQPAAMSHGLSLTAASTIVWYAPHTSNEVFEQANGRINRPGQTMRNFIIMLEGTPIERKIYARLRDKQKLQGILLDEVKARRSEVIA